MREGERNITGQIGHAVLMRSRAADAARRSMLPTAMAATATPQIKDHPDPLQTRRIATEWFRHLPALDVIGRQEHVIRAFDGMRHAGATFDLDRIAAIGYLDAILEVDHRRLVKWYFENLHRTALLADRCWQVANDVNRGFVFAYHAALEGALAHVRDRRWQPVVPLLVARLIHFHGIDAKLRQFHNERWIPAKWAQLHQLFLRAAELGAERVPTALEGPDPLAPRWSVEQEYVYVLLLQQFDTGNLTSADLDWASIQLRAWSRDLVLEARPTTPDGFYVDLSGTSGLIRRTGNDLGARVGYLDTAPLIKRLDAMIATLSETEPGTNAIPPLRQRHIATLEKVRPSLSPRRTTDLRRHARVAVDLAATIRIGLARITADLAPHAAIGALTPIVPPRNGSRGDVRRESTTMPPSDVKQACESRPLADAPALRASSPARPGNGAATGGATAASAETATRVIADAAEGVEEIEIHPVAADVAPEGISVAPPPVLLREPALAPAAEDPLWRVADRSVAGWRLVAPRGGGNGLALGMLVAVRPTAAGDWMLGVVRRIRKRSNDEFEAGMSLITERAVPVTLRARRPVDEDMDFEINGANAVSMGARFGGLYLIPPSPSDTGHALRTLIIPTSEHFEGRSLFLYTSRSNYAVTLRHVVDQHADWSQVAIRVNGRAPRLSS